MIVPQSIDNYDCECIFLIISLIKYVFKLRFPFIRNVKWHMHFATRSIIYILLEKNF